MTRPEQTAARLLEARADALVADLATQDPPPSGSDLAWQQERIRGTYEDAAYLANQQ